MQLQLSARDLAEMLGVSEITIYKREASTGRLRREVWMALDYIAQEQGKCIMPADYLN